MKKYGTPPIEIAKDVIIDNSEMYFYQYLPIAIPDAGFEIPAQLEKLREMVYKCMEDYRSIRPNHKRPYIYITAKCLYVSPGSNINRLGWHCDGFMSDDINYIWCDSIPTEYVEGEVSLIQDHQNSMEEMNEMLRFTSPLYCNTNSIYRLDETVIHRCGLNNSNDAVLRHFVKISFSKEKYNLKGNSHNYLLDYKWDMKERSQERNHPISK